MSHHTKPFKMSKALNTQSGGKGLYDKADAAYVGTVNTADYLTDSFIEDISKELHEEGAWQYSN